MEALRILVTGGGAPGASGIIKAIKQGSQSAQIYSCDANEDTAGRLLSDEYFTVPYGDNKQYIPQLLAQCLEHKINRILPITTKEIHSLSKNKDLFRQNNIDVVVSDFESLNIANDKGKLYTHLGANNIATPVKKPK